MPAGSYLDFFVLESGEYVEALDGIVLRASADGPEAEALLRNARALRGSAAMAKLAAFSQLAAGLERVSRRLAERAIPWDERVKAILVATIDDARILLRNARNWSPADDERARARLSELVGLAPAEVEGAQDAQQSPNHAFFVSESANIAAGLELLITRPTDRPTVNQVLKRVQGLRGVAGVSDLPELAEILATVDEASRSLRARDEKLRAAGTEVLKAGASVLRLMAVELGSGSPANESAPERRALATATEEWAERDLETERIVPISELFFDDQGPTVVERGTTPPATVDERFRLDLVSRGEHLHGLLDWVRGHADAPAQSVKRKLLRALSSISGAARSFGASDLASVVDASVARIRSTGVPELPDLERVAAMLRNPVRQVAAAAGLGSSAPAEEVTAEDVTADAATAGDVTGAEVATLEATEATETVETEAEKEEARTVVRAPESATAPTPVGSTAAPTPPAQAVGVGMWDRPSDASTPSQPSADDAFASLSAGIASIDRLKLTPLATPAVTTADAVVPIEQLLYKGRAALDRAREIRDELRGATPGSRDEALDELFDLLDLAATE